MLTEKYLDLAHIRVNYAEGPPSGARLVLLYGGSSRWQSFNAIIPELMSRWHLFAVDLRGHGKSGRVPKRYRLQDYADDIAHFIAASTKQPAILFGHSLGGIISIMVAAQNQTHIRAIVVGDSPLTKNSWFDILKDSGQQIAVWRDLAGGRYPIATIIDKLKGLPIAGLGQDTMKMRAVSGKDDGVFEWVATNLYHNDPDMLSALIDNVEETAAEYDTEVLLPKIPCPVLLLQADVNAGGLMTDADIDHALKLLPKPTHIRLSDVSHALLRNQYKEPVLAAINTFLASI